MTNDLLLAISTFPDRATAERIVRTLLEKRLIACGNILPEISSLYRWKETIESSAETLVLFKLPSETYESFEKEVRSLHPYEVPEIIACKIERGLPDYLRWLVESC